MEEKILNVFLFNNNIKFSDIAKTLSMRTNKLSYHLNLLVKKGVLKKIDSTYSLTESAEFLIPYLSDKKSLLPVILIGIGDQKTCFLSIRKKKPFLGKYGLPGGRIMLGESLSLSVKRIMKEKYGINATLEKINSVSIEQVRKKGTIIHSFLLIFVKAKTNDTIPSYDIKKMKTKTIKSDYLLITNDFEKETTIKEIYTT